MKTLGIGKSTRILDGGCGNGGVLRIFRNAGHQNLYGMDPVRECCEIAHLCSGAECRDGSLSSPQLGDETFDVIISTQLLEHISDLAAIIGDMITLL